MATNLGCLCPSSTSLNPLTNPRINHDTHSRPQGTVDFPAQTCDAPWRGHTPPGQTHMAGHQDVGELGLICSLGAQVTPPPEPWRLLPCSQQAPCPLSRPAQESDVQRADWRPVGRTESAAMRSRHPSTGYSTDCWHLGTKYRKWGCPLNGAHGALTTCREVRALVPCCGQSVSLPLIAWPGGVKQVLSHHRSPHWLVEDSINTSW